MPSGFRALLHRGKEALPQPLQKLVEHCQHHIASTLFVTACVTILHVGTAWFDALDTYGFMWASNISLALMPDAVSASATDTPPRIAVVEIDDTTFDHDFNRRSPLRRDRIHDLLEKIYAAKPSLLVIDLDLAPADEDILLEQEKGSEGMQAALRDRIATSGVRTVLLEPFPTLNDSQKPAREKWRASLEDTHTVFFGDGGIPERFGMSNRFFADEHSLYAVARRAANAGNTEYRRAPSKLARDRETIDPRAYLRKLEVVTTSAGKDEPELTCRIRKAFGDSDCAQPAPETPNEKRVVYFGAAYGEDDLFTTPLGRLYGVEVHAAAFATETQSTWIHPLALLLETVIALGLGILITKTWKRYMRWRMDPDPAISAVAGVAAFKLMCALVGAIALFSLFALFLLAFTGIWLSSIPVAIGMFIEAWVFGPISEPAPAGTKPPAEEVIAAPKLLGVPFTAASLTLLKRFIWAPVVATALLLAFIAH